jgi:hypothetical protein
VFVVGSFAVKYFVLKSGIPKPEVFATANSEVNWNNFIIVKRYARIEKSI